MEDGSPTKQQNEIPNSQEAVSEDDISKIQEISCPKERDNQNDEEDDTKGDSILGDGNDNGGDDNSQDSESKLSKLKKRLAWLEDSLRESHILGCQPSFVSGSTQFAHQASCDGKVRRLLCHNHSGKISLSLNVDDLEELEAEWLSAFDEADKSNVDFSKAFAMRNLWLNTHAKGNVEVESFEVGEGKRVQEIENKRGFNLASISGEGFVLARSGCYAHDDDRADWLPSLFEYRPFNARLSTAQKASWIKYLPFEEVLVSVCIGVSFVAVATDPPYCSLRVFSLQGVSLYTASLSHGVPVSLAASSSFFILIEQEARPSLPWDFKEATVPIREVTGQGERNVKSFGLNVGFDRYERLCQKVYHAATYVISNFPLTSNQAAWVHLCHRSRLLLFGDDTLTHVSFTRKDQVPVVVTRRGLVYGLLPMSTTPGWLPHQLSQFSDGAQLEPPSTDDSSELKTKIDDIKVQSSGRFVFEWTPLSEPLCRVTKRSIYVVALNTDSIDIILYDTYVPIPILGEQFTQFKTVRLRIPPALPVTLMAHPDLPCDMERWYKAGVGTDVTNLPWPFMDELRHRQLKAELCQKIWKTSLHIAEEEPEETKTLRKAIEILTLKECVAVSSEAAFDRLAELAQHLSYTSSLDFLVRSTTKKGERTVSEEILNIKKTKELLKDLRHNLTTELEFNAPILPVKSSSLDTADTPVKAPLKETQDENVRHFGSNALLGDLIHKCVTKKRKMEPPV
eukprot:Blabericola_migrator_1__1434@NODE_1377_length_4688_cov_1003_981822_g923_i0_p1_GENE_NODE_1377_length_4688_cov_1003_981822_g923_i0NODE_1377_length_4688_cov_1003_981822_g923_i0_p1_ORF_typecomplete_len737_score185_41Mcl1_mid/PF12341_8/1_7e26_NODE_1377_length_4688_cov_1003_981822_g923_i013253535